MPILTAISLSPSEGERAGERGPASAYCCHLPLPFRRGEGRGEGSSSYAFLEKLAPMAYTHRVLKRFSPILLLVAVCWVVFALNNLLCQGRLNQYGITPRHPAGLLGIIWAPFLHGSLAHLTANTLPLLVLGAILCARNKNEFVFVAVGGTILGG